MTSRITRDATHDIEAWNFELLAANNVSLSIDEKEPSLLEANSVYHTHAGLDSSTS